MRKKSFLLAVALFLGLSLLLGGCSQKQASDKTTGQKDDYVVYTVADSNGDWGFPSPWGHYQRGPGYLRMSFIFDTLIWKDEQGFVPALASEWQYDQENKSYIFTLRDDVFWHDGQKLTVDDVIFTWEYMQEHTYPWVDLSYIENIEAKENNQIEIKLKTEYAPFLANVAGTLPIIPKHIWQNVTEPEKFTEPEAAIGSGPFKYVDYNKEHGTYLYQANENYYNGQVRVDQLKFIKLNPQMTVAALQKGEVQAAAIQPEMAEQLNTTLQVLTETGSSNVKLMFNHRQDPLNNKEFRQALAYALDREELVAKAVRGFGLAGHPWLYTPDSFWYNPNVEQYEYDPQKTAEILTKLGYQRDPSTESAYWFKDNKQLQLGLLCDANLIRAAEIIKEQLAKVGIAIEIKSVETQSRDARILAWDFDLALNSHGGLGGDPELLNRFFLDEAFNSARFQANRELVSLIQQQATIMEEEARKELVDEIQTILAEEVAALTLYYPQAFWAHNGQVPLFYTKGGIAGGIPLPLNKLSFIES